ncbi:MAG: heparinase II/III family protein [Kineosporiaceae bacterium]|nr:heparinase II/III family protein [Kineosporiaceae bacterium]
MHASVRTSGRPGSTTRAPITAPITVLIAVLIAVLMSGPAAVVFAPTVSPAQAASGPPPTLTQRSCPGYSGLTTTNPYLVVKTGRYTSGGRSTYPVASMPASVTTAWGAPAKVTVGWAKNPYGDISWQSWLHSLKWMGALVATGGGSRYLDANGVGRTPTTDERWDALALALGATKNYLDTYPKVATSPDRVQVSSFAHRTQFLACLAETLGPANTPAWLATAAKAHAAYLSSSAHYAAVPNQAMDQDLGVLAVGCVFSSPTYRNLAVNRLGKQLVASIGADGVPLEQAPGYSGYVYRLWANVSATYTGCGLPSNGAIPARMAGIPIFLAHATQPNGRMVQIGDTTAAATPSMPGSEYPASLGSTGTAPAQRVANFTTSGFIFGRSAWNPFGTSSFYSVRYGPPVTNHGHFDRTAVTWIVGGRDRLVDSGHVGYANPTLRSWLVGPDAHNVVTADQFRGFRPTARRSHLLASTTSDPADTFLLDAQTYGYPVVGGTGYTTQRRGLLIARNPDLLVVRDAAWGAPKTVTWRQHWHLPVGWTASVLGANRVEAASGSSRTTLVRIAGTGAQSAKLAGSYQSPDIGKAYRNLDVQFPTLGRSMNAITVVAPAASSQVSVGLSGTTLTVVVGGDTVTMTLNPDGSLTRTN